MKTSSNVIITAAAGAEPSGMPPLNSLPRGKIEPALEDLDLSAGAFDANGGWGLHIVQAPSGMCGATREPSGGKWIWARSSPDQADIDHTNSGRVQPYSGDVSFASR